MDKPRWRYQQKFDGTAKKRSKFHMTTRIGNFGYVSRCGVRSLHWGGLSGYKKSDYADDAFCEVCSGKKASA